MKFFFTLLIAAFASINLNAQMSPPNESCGKVLNLDGTWDHVVMNSIADALYAKDVGDKFTIEFWMKTTDANGNIFSMYTPFEFVSYELYIRMQDGQVGTGETFSSLHTKTPFRVDDDVWHHVAVSYDGDNARLYVDGVYIAGYDQNFTIRNNTRVSLGMTDLPNTGKQEFFKGQIDELRIWHSVRTLEEISTNKDVKLIGDEADLLAYYDFDEGNNSEEVHDQTTSSLTYKITSTNLKNTRLNPNGTIPTRIDNVIITNPSCFEREDGSMEVEVLTEAASMEYSFPIEPGFSDVNISTGLGHGSYQAIIRDSEGCYDSIYVDLDHGEEYEVTIEDKDYELTIDISPYPRPLNSHWIDCESGETVAVLSKTFFKPEYDSYYKMAYVINETCRYESECIPWGAANIFEAGIKSKFEVYPNPSNGILNISYDADLSGGLVTIYDITGVVINSSSMTDNSNTQIDISNFANGVYFVEYAKNDSKGVYKIIKK